MTIVLAPIVMIGVLVVIHEFGHFLVARLFGIGTPVFSVGMGPRLFGVRLFDTDFRISALPLGGYVQMAGADPFGEDDPDNWVDPKRDFMRKPVWQRLLVMLAGPVMNLALPFVLFTVMFMSGLPQWPSIVGYVDPGSVAASAGLQSGDRIVELDGDPIELWDEVSRELREKAGQPMVLTVARGEVREKVILPAEAVRLRRDGAIDWTATGFDTYRKAAVVGVVHPDAPAAKAGLQTGDRILRVDGAAVETWDALKAALAAPGAHVVVRSRVVDGEAKEENVELVADPLWANPPWAMDADGYGLEYPHTTVGAVNKGSAAELAGVKPGDRIVAVDGVKVRSWNDIVSSVARTASDGGEPRELSLALARNGESVTLTFRPTVEREVGIETQKVTYRAMMGVGQVPSIWIANAAIHKYYGPVEAFGRSVDQVKLLLAANLQGLWNIVSGQVAVTDGLGGPVAIAAAAGEAARQGVFNYVWLMAGFSLSLGVLNLLPVPLLDGGHIVFYTIEGIRGRPVPSAIRDRIQMVSVVALAALVLVILVSDVNRLFGG